MKILLKDKFLSLLPFEANLPDFTLITGLNGSGKSQLLHGISEGRVECYPAGYEGGAARQGDQIIKFTAASFGGGGFLQPAGDIIRLASVTKAVSIADDVFRPLQERWLQYGTESGWTHDDLVVNTKRIWSYGDPSKRSALPGTLDALIGTLMREATSLVPTGNPYAGFRMGSVDLSTEVGLPYFLISGEAIERVIFGPDHLFNSAVAEVFARYRNRKLLARLGAMKVGEADSESFERVFNLKYGPPPWSVFNDTLARLGLNATIVPPEEFEFGEYTPQMRTPEGDVFAPDALSTGEWVILNLALCGYQATRGESVSKPRVVLLDEVDAPLHPAMAETYLRIVQETLVDTFGIKVIATTHSPSTVALFKGESVHVMRKGFAGLQPQPTTRALRDLTAGVPTLAVNLDDRRQVFAESEVEAANLDALYHICKPQLDSPITLQFMATGTKQFNSGKSNAARIVNELVRAGNKSVYALLDWDLENKSDDRIYVLAEGRRYALENLVLDPLIVAFAVSRLHPSIVRHVGLGEGDVFVELSALDPDRCQMAVDAVTKRVLGKPPEKRLECSYACGLQLQIDEAYLRKNAHDLDKAVAKAFEPFEKTLTGGSGKLSALMINSVLRGSPHLMPTEIVDAFRSLVKLS